MVLCALVCVCFGVHFTQRLLFYFIVAIVMSVLVMCRSDYLNVTDIHAHSISTPNKKRQNIGIVINSTSIYMTFICGITYALQTKP